MNQSEIITSLNANRPPVWDSLDSTVITIDGPHFDALEPIAHMSHAVGPEFCHSEVIVQGGIVAAMLDSTMTCALFGHFLSAQPRRQVRPATLEFKVSFLKASRLGAFHAVGRARRVGRTVAFIDGELFQQDVLVATATMTSQLAFIDSDVAKL
jgi:uncharacterized protein (TIGR00369 family)